MACDVARGASALGVDRAFEVGALFEREMPGNDVGFDRRVRTDVHAISRDVAFEVAVNRDGACGDRRVDAGPGHSDEMVTLKIDRALEQAVDRHVLTCFQISLDDECGAAAHSDYCRAVVHLYAS